MMMMTTMILEGWGRLEDGEWRMVCRERHGRGWGHVPGPWRGGQRKKLF